MFGDGLILHNWLAPQARIALNFISNASSFLCLQIENYAEASENEATLAAIAQEIDHAAVDAVAAAGHENVAEAVHVRPIAVQRDDLAGASPLCIGMFLHQASNTLHHFNTKPCKQLVKYQPILWPIHRKQLFRWSVRPLQDRPDGKQQSISIQCNTTAYTCAHNLTLADVDIANRAAFFSGYTLVIFHLASPKKK